MHQFQCNQPIPFRKLLVLHCHLIYFLNFNNISESSWLDDAKVNTLRGLESTVDSLKSFHVTGNTNRVAWAIKALTLTDLTTLSGDDCSSNVERLCIRAVFPFASLSLAKSDDFSKQIHVAAVCVYPSKVADAYATLEKLGMTDKIQIAAVATGFPAGLYPLKTRIEEITYAIDQGATGRITSTTSHQSSIKKSTFYSLLEIDIVIDRSLVLTAQWEKLYDEIVAMRKACGDRAHMKTILGIGECGTMENVYKASVSDFITFLFNLHIL